MKKLLFGLLIFGAGVGVGVLTTKKYYEDMMNEVIDEEVSSLRAAYSHDAQIVNDIITDNNMHAGVKVVEREDDYDYSKYAPDKEVPDDVNIINKPEPTDPYLITGNEYLDENHEYEKIGLYYYDEDQVIADDQEEPIQDLDIIGYDIIELFIDDPNLSAIYIRNDSLETDYEIVRVIGSYAESVTDYSNES